mgnify:CR=1 FL=1
MAIIEKIINNTVNSRPGKALATGLAIWLTGHVVINGSKIVNFVDKKLENLLKSETANAAIKTAYSANNTAGEIANGVINYGLEPFFMGAAAFILAGGYLQFSRMVGNSPTEQMIKYTRGTTEQ